MEWAQQAAVETQSGHLVLRELKAGCLEEVALSRVPEGEQDISS